MWRPYTWRAGAPDNWAVGATGRFTVAVWVGNFNGRPMDGVSGVSGAGPLLHRAVLATGRRYPAGSLPDPRASASGRWSLRPGRHRLRAISASGESAEVTVRVE